MTKDNDLEPVNPTGDPNLAQFDGWVKRRLNLVLPVGLFGPTEARDMGAMIDFSTEAGEPFGFAGIAYMGGHSPGMAVLTELAWDPKLGDEAVARRAFERKVGLREQGR